MNKKGTTLIEIIVTITLISLVLLLLFKIILTLNNDNNLSSEEIEILSVKNAITKKIEDCYIEKGKSSNECSYEIKYNNTISGYTLPEGYSFSEDDTPLFEDNKISKKSIKIVKTNDASNTDDDEELDDRFTIKLYYYDKNNN